MENALSYRWERLQQLLAAQFGKDVSMEGILYLVGIRELGVGVREFSKEEKRDLMHIALCRVLAPSGYYTLSHRDPDGWPHWTLVQPLPFTDIFTQELMLKELILSYFVEEDIYPELA